MLLWFGDNNVYSADEFLSEQCMLLVLYINFKYYILILLTIAQCIT